MNLKGTLFRFSHDTLDKIAEKYFEKVQDDEARLFSLIHSPAERKNIKERFLPRFSQIAFLVQMPHMNIEEEVEKIKGESLTGEDREEIKLRVEYAKNWLKMYAPERYKYDLQEDSVPKPALSLSGEQKQVLSKVLEYIKLQKNLDGQELHSKIHEIRKESGIEPKELFSAIYLSFLGKENGPKVGWFLSVLNREFLQKRLEEVTK